LGRPVLWAALAVGGDTGDDERDAEDIEAS